MLHISDLYKLAHQAALGSEHAVKDLTASRSWLLDELNKMDTGPEESLPDEISADGHAIRVHLRPFLTNGGDPELLLQAFIRTANEYQGSSELLEQRWDLNEQLARKSKQPFHPVHLRNYFEALETSGFPAVHHSIEYEAAYQLRYRAITRDYLSILIDNE